MIQTRTNSLVESLINTAIGFGIALITQIIVFYHYDIKASMSMNIRITLIFTVISILRGYCVRRFFTHRTEAV